jgi:hypothetical protein
MAGREREAVTSVLRWEEPPEKRSPGRRPTKAWAEVAEELRGRPGVWAVVHEGQGAHALPGRIKAGASGFAPAGAFEAAVRGSGLSMVVYARYVGEVKP